MRTRTKSRRGRWRRCRMPWRMCERQPYTSRLPSVTGWHAIGCIFGRLEGERWMEDGRQGESGSRLIHCDACSPLLSSTRVFRLLIPYIAKVVMNHSFSHGMPGSLRGTIPAWRQNASKMKSAGLGGKPHTLAAGGYIRSPVVRGGVATDAGWRSLPGVPSDGYILADSLRGGDMR